MNKDILFSVVICCYNSERFLSETIDSIINQTYKNWEIIIINDGSTDRTEPIVLSYINKGIKIKYFKQINMGFAYSRNIALKKSSGDWIAIIDHDDLCLPNRLQIHYEQILNDKNNCKLFFGDTIHFGENINTEIRHLEKFNMNKMKLNKYDGALSLLTRGCFIDSESVIFNKKVAIELGGFNNVYKYVADYDFFIRIAFNYNISYTKNTLSKWRIHKKQASNKMIDINKKELFKIYFNYLFQQKYKFNIKYKMILSFILFKLLIKKCL